MFRPCGRWDGAGSPERVWVGVAGSQSTSEGFKPRTPRGAERYIILGGPFDLVSRVSKVGYGGL